MLQGFYYYWSDEDINGRMKFQLQKTFSLSKRLALWNSNSRKWDKPKSNTTENLTSIAVNGAKMLLNELNRGD